MKIAHLADIHLGYKTGRHTNKQGVNLREMDGYQAFHNVITDIIEQQADVAILAGDLFHTPNPSPRSIIFAQNELRRLSKHKIKLYCLAGNHDATDIHSDIAASRVVNDPDRGLYSYIEPYNKVEVTDGLFFHMVSHHMYAEQEKTMSQVKPVAGAVNILSTHGSIIDPIMAMVLKNQQSPREIVIPDFIVNQDWNYTMLGHIHTRGWVGSRDNKTDTENLKIFYNGSTIRRGFADPEGKLGRGYTLWTLNADGTFIHEFRNIWQRPQHDFILDAANMSSSEITEIVLQNLKATQTDGTNFDATNAPILRQTISNVLPSTLKGVDYQVIAMESKHALTWQLRSTKLALEATPTNKETNIKESGDLISAYDTWAKSSKLVENIDNRIKSKVIKQAKAFIESGQDEVLGADE